MDSIDSLHIKGPGLYFMGCLYCIFYHSGLYDLNVFVLIHSLI